jgi:hypothetical protein
MWNDDQNVDALRQQVFALTNLYCVDSIGGLNEDLGAEFLGASYESVTVVLPAFELK